MTDKLSNPKDMVAGTKVPMHLLSPIAKIHWASALAAGQLKYGAHNYLAAGAQASVYISAIERHLEKWKAGQELDTVDRTHHLGNIMACCSILLDARQAGLLFDDRPPARDIEGAIAEVEATLAFLKKQYADRKPRHYTIADTAEIEEANRGA